MTTITINSNTLVDNPTFDIEGMLVAKANSVTPAETFKEIAVDGALQAGASNIYARLDEARRAFFAWNDGIPLDDDSFNRLHSAYKRANLVFGINKFGLGTKTFASLGPVRIVISRDRHGLVRMGEWDMTNAENPVGLYSSSGLSEPQRKLLQRHGLEWVWEEFEEVVDHGVCWAIPLHAKGDKNEKVLSTYGSYSSFYKDLKDKADWTYSYYLLSKGAAAPTITYAWRDGLGKDQQHVVQGYDPATQAMKNYKYAHKRELICGGQVAVESFLVEDLRIPGPIVLREGIAICNVPWERWGKGKRRLISNSKRDPYDRRHMYSRVFFGASYDDAVGLNETKTKVELDMAIKETLANHHDTLYTAASQLRAANAKSSANNTKTAPGTNGIKTAIVAPPSHQGMGFSLSASGLKLYEDSSLYSVITSLPANSRHLFTEFLAAIEESYTNLGVKAKIGYSQSFHDVARTLERKILAHSSLSKIK